MNPDWAITLSKSLGAWSFPIDRWRAISHPDTTLTRMSLASSTMMSRADVDKRSSSESAQSKA
jgi:hypothetical protein